MNEYQKAALSVIQGVSVQLILVAVGAIAIVGNGLVTRNAPTKSKWALYVGIVGLMLSVLFGLFALGNAVAQLAEKAFDAYDPILRWSYLVQLVSMMAGGGFFVGYLVRNIP
jgi:hypothetical protein